MRDNETLSSVQALDNYFDALLDETIPEPQLERSNEDVASVDTAEVAGATEEQDSAQQNNAEESVADFADNISEQATLESMPQPALSASFEEYPLQPQPVFQAATDFHGAIHGATLAQEERDLAHVERLLAQLKVDDKAHVEIAESVEESVTETVIVDTDTDAQTKQNIDTQTATEVELPVSDVVATVDSDVESKVVEELATVADNVTESNAKDTTEQVIDSVTETQSSGDIPPTQWKNVDAEKDFQVLFFESFGVTYAVPLAELGGIHQLSECNHLIGRPNWYLGLQTEREQQLDVVDTAKWVMPEKIKDNAHREDYSYIVLLGDSKWGLACNTLLGTQSLNSDQVRWREQAGKRPWLAGMVKEKMCALIHVEAFIAMLNQGIDANAMA